jgi:hypothetical protein
MIWYDMIPYYIGNFNTNYIIFIENLEFFWKNIFQQKKLVNEKIESSRIFYLSKLKFLN